MLVAAGLVATLAGAHSYLGERYIITRLLRRENLPTLFGDVEFTKRTLRFAWHITSVAWLGLAGVLVAMAPPGGVAEATQLRVVSVTFGVSGLLALVGSRGRHLSWVVFFSIAALSWVATT